VSVSQLCTLVLVIGGLVALVIFLVTEVETLVDHVTDMFKTGHLGLSHANSVLARFDLNISQAESWAAEELTKSAAPPLPPSLLPSPRTLRFHCSCSQPHCSWAAAHPKLTGPLCGHQPSIGRLGAGELCGCGG
jgi:hypothetical protein